MSIYKRKFSISLPFLILLVSGLLVSIFVYLSISMTDKTLFAKEGPLWVFAAGMVPGLVVGLMQFVLSWVEFSKISKFQKMMVKDILESRDQEEYYRELIINAKSNIQVLGVTASRFVTDFADESAIRDEKKVLLAALNRGVKVQILVPESKYLSPEDQLRNFPAAQTAFVALQKRYPQQFEFRYFDHSAIASVVRVDEEVVMGPVFTNRKSRHTPAIHASSHSPLSASYLNYFEEEWPTARTM